MQALSLENKLTHATDGENGLWLFENHHKLFDEGYISFDNDGNVLYRTDIEPDNINYIDEVTTNHKLSSAYLAKKIALFKTQK